MPSIAAHMICAQLVANSLNINSPEFIKGNLLPDIINHNNSHHKIKGQHYYVPDIDYFLTFLDLQDPLSLGYLTHLLLDKYFLENYIYDVVNGQEVFLSRRMYQEYDIINYELLKKFNINISYLNSILKDFTVDINEQKYYTNLKSLNNIDRINHLKYLNVENFSKFLIAVSNLIANYLKEVKKDASKSRLSHYSLRK